jgi:membrane fusion protein, copper/silver efflux system
MMETNEYNIGHGTHGRHGLKAFNRITFGGFLVLLIIIISGVSSCKAKDEVPLDPDIYYTCSMDPQVVENKPGICPICKMELTPVQKKKGEKRDELQLSDQQIQLGNIHTDTIRNGSLGDTRVLPATLNFDQHKVTAVSARIMGRVEKLYFKNIGDVITAGAPLFELYSEELNNAKQEYLLALDRQGTFRDNLSIDMNQLVESAKNKLLLWGMTEAQVKELAATKKASPFTRFFSPATGTLIELGINEGDYVMEGSTLVKLADMSTVWAEAQVYASQFAAIDMNSLASVQIPDLGNKVINGRMEFINPEINTDSRINLIRITLPNANRQLRPGMPAYVLLKSPQRNMLSLPIDAVIRDGKGASVWILSGSNTFKSRMVTTGLESDDRIEIVAGLKESDIVVISGAYLLHSEYVFKKGADPMEAHNH